MTSSAVVFSRMFQKGMFSGPLRRLPLHHVSLEAALIAGVRIPRTLAFLPGSSVSRSLAQSPAGGGG